MDPLQVRQEELQAWQRKLELVNSVDAQDEHMVPLSPLPLAHSVHSPVMLLQAEQVVQLEHDELELVLLLKVLAGQT